MWRRRRHRALCPRPLARTATRVRLREVARALALGGVMAGRREEWGPPVPQTPALRTFQGCVDEEYSVDLVISTDAGSCGPTRRG